MSSKNQKYLTRDAEVEAARKFGKQMNRKKAYLLAFATTAACMMPMLLGIRLWDSIPEIVETGLLTFGGADDSMPRYIVVFGLPGLMTVLNIICHVQLMLNQNRMTVPHVPVRLLGRWGFPFLSVFCCSYVTIRSADEPLRITFFTACILGYVFLVLGAHMIDVPRDSGVALRFSFTESDEGWRAVHRFAGIVWLAAGIAVLAFTMLSSQPEIPVCVIAVAACAAPFVFGLLRRDKQHGKDR